MATQIKRFYVKQGDWQTIFENLKLQAFTLNFVDFYNYLQTAKVDCHGRIESVWNDQALDLLIKGKKSEFNQMEIQAKQIVKQARQLGLKAAYNNLSRLHLRDLA